MHVCLRVGEGSEEVLIGKVSGGLPICIPPGVLEMYMHGVWESWRGKPIKDACKYDSSSSSSSRSHHRYHQFTIRKETRKTKRLNVMITRWVSKFPVVSMLPLARTQSLQEAKLNCKTQIPHGSNFINAKYVLFIKPVYSSKYIHSSYWNIGNIR